MDMTTKPNTNALVEEKITEILQEYPSHPPMKGSEQGINIVTVEKLATFAEQMREEGANEAAGRIVELALDHMNSSQRFRFVEALNSIYSTHLTKNKEHHE